MQQNVLPLLHTKGEFVFDTWISESNPKCTQWLQERLIRRIDDGNVLVYLWGPPGSGRSHLSQACSQWLATKKQSVFYLSLQQANLSPQVLENLQLFDWVILDDISPILHEPTWQEPFIELYHHMLHQSHRRLILTHHSAPHHLNGLLADTTTRIQSALALRVDPLTDVASLKRMLEVRARFRQLHVADRCFDFLLHHTERSAPHLIDILDHLETQSLIEKRPISIPFIKAHLEG